MKRWSFPMLLVSFLCALFLTSCSSNGYTPPGGGPDTTFTVSYDGNSNTGGTVPTDSGLYQQGQNVMVASNTGLLTKSGFTFAGWNTNSNPPKPPHETRPEVATGTRRTCGLSGALRRRTAAANLERVRRRPPPPGTRENPLA